MKNIQLIQLLLAAITILIINSCAENHTADPIDSTKQQNEAAFHQTLDKHLTAIINKDLATLETTLPPDGNMILIMQGSELIHSVDSFLNFHRVWYQDSLWTMETKTIKTEVGESVGFAVTESVYREPERDGKPYFNRMITSYVLEKTNGNWYVVNDHVSSIVKSTDKE